LESSAATQLRIRTTSSSSEPQMIMIDGAGDYFAMQKVDKGMTFKPQGVVAIKIDDAGIVTKPLQPAFGARRNGNQTGFNSSGAFGDPVIFNLEFETDKNGDYNTSTGLFTAPVDGTYWFQASVYGNVTFSQSWLTINNARASFNDFSVSGSANTVFCSLFYAELDANDTVGFHPYNSSYSSVTINDDNNHTYFRGGLLY
jgi:hypothetical protein